MGPETDGAPGDVLGSDWSEIAAVEAGGMRSEKEELSGLQRPAAMPGRHRPPSAVGAKGERCEPVTNKDASPEPADAIARNSRDRLQQIGGTRQIGSVVGEGSDGTSEMREHQVTDAVRRPIDPIESDRNTGRRVPDETRQRLP
jgi:hypothetical protein